MDASETFQKIKSFTRLVLRGRPSKALVGAYVEVLRTIFDLLPHDGVTVTDEDWDVLVVLDACRYDTYDRVVEFDGDLDSRTSQGSNTTEWLKANFEGSYDDIVYVSANPRVSHTEVDGFRGADHFHRIIDVWETDWDAEVNTVRPQRVTEAAIEAHRRYPDKRLIVHYIQPHAPWIGDTIVSDRETSIEEVSPDKWINAGKTWGTMLNEGKDTKTIKTAYEDNLRLVLESVGELLKAVSGRVVVTSDHGECFGEKFIIEHPPGIYIRELVEVPWHVVKEESSGRDPNEHDSERERIRRSLSFIDANRL